MEKLIDIIKENDVVNMLKEKYKVTHISYKVNDNNFIYIDMSLTGQYSIENEEELDNLCYISPTHDFTVIDKKEEYRKITDENEELIITYKYDDVSSNINHKFPSGVEIRDLVNDVTHIHDYTLVTNNNTYYKKFISEQHILYTISYKNNDYSIIVTVVITK